jgi:hypothetical protein
MDDWSFNIPKKILRFLLLGAVVLAVLYGLITWDSKKGAEFYMKEVEFITKPIVNKLQERIQRIFDRTVNKDSQESVDN